jgi:phosphoribosylglycinamide formyltransferase-1
LNFRITFLCSGGGGNLKLIAALAGQGALPHVRVAGVIADRDCPAVRWATSQGINAQVLTYTRAQSEALHNALVQETPDLVVTTVHKILDEQLVTQYSGRLVNLHYSLLPAFAGKIGMEPVRMARTHGCRLIGATAHRVTSDLDAGPILAQACVFDDPETTEGALCDAVFRSGGIALAAAVDVQANPGVRPVGGQVWAGSVLVTATPVPRPEICAAVEKDAFWETLR